MKNYRTLLAFSLLSACIATIPASAQHGSLSGTPLSGLYLDIKDALVNSDGTMAASKAAEFSKALASVDGKALPDADRAVFLPLQQQLSSDALRIAGTKDLSRQRESFAGFSRNFSTLAKAIKISDRPLYQAYCPMKKAVWLSKETAIKNPYYGQAMLTCGNITDTLKP